MSSGLKDSDSDIHDNKHTESEFLEQRAQVHALTRGFTDPAIRYVDELVLHYKEELEILELGCGFGHHARRLAVRLPHARVEGVDISENRITKAREGAPSNVTFQVMDISDMKYPDGRFDLVLGFAVVHHVEVRGLMAEIHRILKPGGRGVFLEPLGHNSFINAYRNRTPGARFESEHPLTRSDLNVMRQMFSNFDAHYYSLTDLGLLPVRWLLDRSVGTRLSNALLTYPLKALAYLDRVLFTVLPPSRLWAWKTVIEVTK